jgi:hypothetical protein
LFLKRLHSDRTLYSYMKSPSIVVKSIVDDDDEYDDSFDVVVD